MIDQADRLMYSIKNSHKNDILHCVKQIEPIDNVCKCTDL